MNQFSKTEAFTHSFQLMLRNFWLWIKVALTQVAIILLTGISWFLVTLFIMKFLAYDDPMGVTFKVADHVYFLSLAQLITLVLLFLAYFIFMFAFWVGYNKVILEVDKTGKGHIKTLFHGFGLAWPRLLIATFLYFIIVVLGLIVFVIPGVFFIIRFYFINWLILDKNRGVIASFKESWSITREHTWPLFIFVLCIMLITAATKGWALIFIMPFTFLASIYVYRKLER